MRMLLRHNCKSLLPKRHDDKPTASKDQLYTSAAYRGEEQRRAHQAANGVHKE